MASCPVHPAEIFVPAWHAEHETPIVDGKYHDIKTGEIVEASDEHEEYQGPPAVDVVIRSQHEETENINFRMAMPFPMGILLCHMMRVVADRKLELDSVMATAYTIRVILSHELTRDQFLEIVGEMTNGIYDYDSK